MTHLGSRKFTTSRHRSHWNSCVVHFTVSNTTCRWKLMGALSFLSPICCLMCLLVTSKFHYYGNRLWGSHLSLRKYNLYADLLYIQPKIILKWCIGALRYRLYKWFYLINELFFNGCQWVFENFFGGRSHMESAKNLGFLDPLVTVPLTSTISTIVCFWANSPSPPRSSCPSPPRLPTSSPPANAAPGGPRRFRVQF